MFTVRLLMTRLFVVFTPAAIDKDPETMNIIGPQIGTSKITEKTGPSRSIFIIIIIPVLVYESDHNLYSLFRNSSLR